MSYVSPVSGKRKKLFYYSGALVLVILVTAGIFASNGWFPSTDSFSGKRTGWFGKPLAKNAPSAWNPLPPPSATPLPLSKEYIYAGSRLLAVEDANANPAPPADLAVWRPSNGYFYVLGGPGSQLTYYQWGGGTNGYDWPVPGDYDGDGKTDFSIYRPTDGTWWITYSSNGSYGVVQYGASCTDPTHGGCNVSAPVSYNGDIPDSADYDGDGKTDIALFRPSTGNWYVINSSTGQAGQFHFGSSGDIPASADFDGDGRADYAVWRSSNRTFYAVLSSNGSIAITQSAETGMPVPADYDGDGKADIAVYGGGTTPTWYISPSSGISSYQLPFGASGDQLVQNDYDGDGKCDIAVWRPSTGDWFIRNSSNGNTRTEHWGAPGDIPVPAYYRR